MSPTGGISGAATTPVMWRANRRVAVIRRGPTILAGSTCGAVDQATAAATMTVDALISSIGDKSWEQAVSVGQVVTEPLAQREIIGGHH